jgi:hypothetical protein
MSLGTGDHRFRRRIVREVSDSVEIYSSCSIHPACDSVTSRERSTGVSV